LEQIEILENTAVTGLLNAGTKFEGNLSFEGCVRMAGEFKGEIFTKDTLIISSEARVQADIEASSIILSGYLEGNIIAKKQVIMRPPAVFKGSVTTPSLKISEGVVFQGASYMKDQKNQAINDEANAAY